MIFTTIVNERKIACEEEDYCDEEDGKRRIHNINKHTTRKNFYLLMTNVEIFETFNFSVYKNRYDGK